MMVSFATLRRRAARLGRFGRDEGGNLVVFALCLFVAMAAFGGLAVDIMRYETVRTKLQNTLDRSTLAAASLTQALDAESVVNDYFAKAGLLEFLTGVTVDEGINYREVTADASATTNPYFLHMLGIPEMDAPGHSVAEQRITNVEIVLVLDVSGSMAGSKLTNLKAAATEFVDTVLDSDGENRISIAVVPYNAQVNLGATLRGQFNAAHQHGVANVDCLELPSTAFSAIPVSQTDATPMSAFADVTSSTSQSTSYVSWSDSSNAKMSTSAPFCRNTAANIVRLPSNDAATIKSRINALVAAGNTSITLGMKWGVALIDPAARTMFDDLISANAMSSLWSGRPYDYTDDEAMKIIVLMTDGEHVSHSRINDDYKTGLSPIWKSTGDGHYSIQHTTGRPAAAGTNQYWVPHLCTSSSCRDGSNTSSAWRSAPYNSGSGVTQQTWQQVWASQRLTWVAWQLYARGLGTSSSTRNSRYNSAISMLSSTYASVSTMNTTLQQSCTLAKQNEVTIYGIAFEAPSTGQAQISACASSSAHYFNATGLQISSAFRSIASNISQLRLTQ